MEWVIGIVFVTGAYLLIRKSFAPMPSEVSRATGNDEAVANAEALTQLLELYGAASHEVNNTEYEKAVLLTTNLRIGLHALRTDNGFMLDETVLSMFKQVAGNGVIIETLLRETPHKIPTFKAALAECYHRLQLLHEYQTQLQPDTN